MKILLAVDGSPFTKRMLAYVAAHEEIFGAAHDYTVMTVVTPITAHARSFVDRATLDNYYRDEAAKVLDPVLAFAGQQRWAPKVEKPVGHAADVIAETARAGRFDLIVMGSHGYSALGNIVLGSVTQRVLAGCEVPLLIIR